MLANFTRFGSAAESRAEEEEAEARVAVYVGYHEHRFPEIPADKHREHVVRAPHQCFRQT